MEIKTINFIRKKGSPVYKQIFQKIQEDILSGQLQSGERLPSIRKCEQLFKVSKTSIERAFLQLVEEGYIASRPQSGYYVAVNDEQRKLRRSIMQQPIYQEQREIRYDFRSQTMDDDAFDIAIWKKYLREVLEHQKKIVTYGDAQGEIELRVALQKYAYSVRGVMSDVDQIMVGSSFQSLLYLLCGLLPKNSVIGIEETGFPQAEAVFDDYGIKVVRLAMKEDGVAIEDLVKYHVTVLYLNSGSQGKNHQPIRIKKQKALLSWAKRNNAYIIEDDHNGELRYTSRVTSAMQAYDDGNHVFYIGSFSKLLLPSLRISYLIFTKEIKKRFEKRKSYYAPTSSKIEQLALAHYIGDGQLERHVKRLRKRYEAKSKEMMKGLHKIFPNAILLLEEAALQIIVRFPYPFDIDAFIMQADKKNILIQKNSMQELVVSFAAIPLLEIEKALDLLVEGFKHINC